MASEPRVDGTGTMDYAEHNKTYELFTRMTAVLTPVFITWVLAVGVGGMKHRPVIALLIVLLSSIAGAVGLASRAAGWWPALIMMVLAFFAFILL